MSKNFVPPVQQKKRPPHLWKKGQSGNPSGRIAFPHELRLAFQEYTQQALDTLVKALDAENPYVQIKAAEVILNRGWGPPQPMEHTEEESKGEMLADFSKLNDKEWEQFKKLNHKVLVQTDDTPDPARDQKVWMKQVIDGKT